ncbi:MAG TPA: two-component system sensor histidine kinase/response regulator [Cyanobacteria bacterium UBA11049]|nr:two-component system sensor histidine kinase/response regulator [Cyanobacteria bacterium UBA11049]
MNWSIEKRLIAGLSLVFAIAASVGVVSYRTITGLSETAQWVEHTYQVLSELDVLLFQINKAEADQRNYLLTENESYTEQYTLAVMAANQKIEQLKRLTRDNPVQQQRLDVVEPLINSRFAVLEETTKLRKNQGFQAAQALVVSGKGKQLMDNIRQVLDRMKAEENNLLQRRSEESRMSVNNATQFFFVLTLLIFFFLILCYYFLSRYLKEREVSNNKLRKFPPMVEFAEKIAVGEFPAPLPVDSNDEVGDLSASLNQMLSSFLAIVQQIKAIAQGNYNAEIAPRSDKDEMVVAFSELTRTLRESTAQNQRENWLRTSQTELNERLRGEQELTALAQEIISYIATRLNAQVGAIYLGNENKQFRLISSYAYTKRKNLSNEFKLGEGIVGQAALEKKTILITNIPSDYIAITSGLGEAVPRNLIVVPLIYRDVVEGVIEIASFQEITDIQIEFLNQVAEGIAIAFHSNRSRAKIQQLLEESQVQSEELQAQQEELRQTNEELHEKANLLLKQNQEVEKKNREIEQAQAALEEKAEQLALTSKYKSEFLANMSHELRTPLNSLLILSKLLSENKEANLTSKQVEYASTIYTAGTDLLNLINEILDLAKIESGTMTLEIGEVVLTALRDDIERNFRHVAQSKGVGFTIELDTNLPRTIRIDEKRLHQVLKNLLSNAFKFTAQGQVSLRIDSVTQGWSLDRQVLNRAGAAIAFSVSDTGIGIPAEKQKLIFEAFQQADGTTSRHYGGTGLGLSISREIAHLLNGEIRLTSTPGKGSTFTLYLPQTSQATGDRGLEARDSNQKTVSGNGRVSSQKPLSDPPLPLAVTPNSSSAPLPLPKRPSFSDDRDAIQPGDRTLLIVEDDVNFARILLDTGREQGFKGIVALQGDTGLALAQQFRPTAIMLDIGLPEMDGWTVLDRLKHDPQTRHIPVHIVSGLEERQRSLQLGAIAYLQKPVGQESLIAALTNIQRFVERPLKRLLVVEDNEQQRQSIVELIGDGDVRTTAVGTGGEALAALRASPFDCVVLDLGLPDMSGFELIKQIEQRVGVSNGGRTSLPIIIYTGKNLTEQEETELRRVTEAIIVKDVKSPERLLDETALFLHRVQSNLPEAKQQILAQLRQQEPVLAGKKILIVDDDVRNIFALTSILEEHQMEVVFAENGRKGIDLLQNTPDVDAVLMDIMMPEMDGYETMRAIRSESKFRSLPILALTAKAMKGDREKCLEAGASDYIAKPVDTEQLLSLLRVWLYR